MIHVIETLDALPGKAEELKKALLAMVPLSRAEKGCISYDLFQEHDNPHRFAVIMRWKDKQAYDGHNAAAFIQKFVEKFDNVLYCNVVETSYKSLN